MNRGYELLKNTGLIFIGKFSTQFIAFLLIPIYTRYLLPADYGYVDLIQSYVTLLVPILILRFDSAIFRFLIDARDDEEDKKRIISSSIFVLIIQVIIFLIFYFICIKYLEIKYLLWIAINIISIASSSILLQLTRGIGDNIGYSIASIISAIITIVLNSILIIKFHFDSSSILIVSSIANIVCSIFLVLRNNLFQYINLKSVNSEKLRDMLRYSIPMVPDGLSWWIVNVSDRTIISLVLGTVANGIYAISGKFSNILSSILQIFNMSWQESAILHISDHDRAQFFSSILNKSYKIFYSICILIMIFLPFVYNILIGERYKEAYSFIPLLLLGSLFNTIANVIGGVYIAKKKTKKVALTTMLGAMMNLFINIFFINKIGIWAAVISTLISYIMLAMYRYIDVQKDVRMKLNYKMLIETLCVFFISYALYTIDTSYCNILNFVIVVVYLFTFDKDIILELINNIKNHIKVKLSK